MSLRVSLARPLQPRVEARPLLDPRGARVILGASDPDSIAMPVVPAADTLFGPRGVVSLSPDGALFVCDTGHHRLLGWRRSPGHDNAPADIVIGQKSFSDEGRNANGEPHAASLNVPTGVAAGDGMLAVADAWNHRVLLWWGFPKESHRPADVVLGQADFSSTSSNRGGTDPNAATLHWPYGVSIIAGRLYVADTGNRRILIWNEIPQTNGAPADLVLGQRDFTTRDENAGVGVCAFGMRWPHAIAVLDDALFVADAGNNRVMGWNRLPTQNGSPCDFVLGQGSPIAGEHNGGAYNPTPVSLNMPYGLAVLGSQLIIADTANSRVIGFDSADLRTGAGAACLAGQNFFEEKGDNRWQKPARNSFCWPYGIAACDNGLAIADSGNNRILLWQGQPSS